MRSIMFRPDMIKAIREGRKTVTRRVIKPQPPVASLPVDFVGEFSILGKGYRARYQPGEVVYIKEAWASEAIDDELKPCEIPKGYPIYYKHLFEQTDNFGAGRWRSPLFMMEWMARYFLQMLDVRAERLQEITENDCIAEGCEYPTNWGSGSSFRYSYQIIWDSINKDHPWASNPFVWVYSFKRVDKV